MEAQLLARLHSAARAVLAFVFIYHGLVPKILWLSPTEAALATAHGLYAPVISPLAGVGEILLGGVILLWRKSLIPVHAAMAALVVLLLDVMIMMPMLLTEAFNPVTLNLAVMFIGYIVVVTQPHALLRMKRSGA
jgi:hypothetical protein